MLSPEALPSMSWILLSCLMLLSQVQGEDSEEKFSSPQRRCPEGSYAYRSNCYALFITPKSWNDAEIACQKRTSGSLVSVLGKAESFFLASMIKDNLNNCPYIWIGVHDPTQGNEPNADGWEWSNNDVMNYIAWERDPTTAASPGYCGSLSQSSRYLKWRDYNCYEKLPYICKFKD